ncbi:hypothetical protein OIV83_001631 [Microbotryomycetes sp. JL201]|nr:hypothetical protein OIV83_001631 [Microbotryomycetes sp. JL201]
MLVKAWATAAACAACMPRLVTAISNGYGRFPCSRALSDGTFEADPTLCASDRLVMPGRATGRDMNNQGDGINPVNPQCVADTNTGAFFCGISGARCETDLNCDNGKCVGGSCAGGLGYECNGSDTSCLGYLYCNAALFDKGITCGGVGAFCQDYTQGSAKFTDEENYATFNQFCSSGYCNTLTGNCDVHGGEGDDCSSDPTYFCDHGLICGSDSKCVKATSAVPTSKRKRSKQPGFVLHERFARNAHL